jgi:putative RNA 2'-phosphotransferase
MNSELKVKVSKYMSYLLRHNPENLRIDKKGFVDLDEFLLKVREKYGVDKCFIVEMMNQRERRRFEIVGDKVRALYGHSVEVKVRLEEDKSVAILYHETTPELMFKILRNGLKPMKRRWVHLSPTKDIAIEVGRRRALKPIVFEIIAKDARKNGLRLFRATEQVFVCREVPPRYIRLLS